ncbi:uncharacterized protein BDZ99DRAFT_362518, partial [Mytilinidion resinicola]
IIAIDCEWHVYEPRELTEIGIAMLDTRDIQGVDPGKHGENWLNKIWFYHLRIREHGHLINRWHCIGSPFDFHWGTTKWVTKPEARAALIECFSERLDPYARDSEPCPAVFVGHDVRGDLESLNQHLGFNADSIGSVVTTLDTQTMANACGIRSGVGPTINLGLLCNKLGITETPHLHNAGNDAAYTLIYAVLMVLPQEELNSAEGKSMQDMMNSLMKTAMLYQPPAWGIKKFCTRCNRIGNQQPECLAPVECSKCKVKGRRGFRSHATARC